MLYEHPADTRTGAGSGLDLRSASPHMRVMIADDEPLSRERVRSLLERAGWTEIIGEFADGAQTIRAIRAVMPRRRR